MRVSPTTAQEHSSSRQRVLWLSTLAFTLLFNVWLMLGVLGIPICQDLGLSDAQLEWLIATPILSGAVLRLHFGIWAEAYGGRLVTGVLLLGVASPRTYSARRPPTASCWFVRSCSAWPVTVSPPASPGTRPGFRKER